jgi:hypothetical protein
MPLNEDPPKKKFKPKRRNSWDLASILNEKSSSTDAESSQQFALGTSRSSTADAPPDATPTPPSSDQRIGVRRQEHLAGGWTALDDKLVRITPELESELRLQMAEWLASEDGKWEIFQREILTRKWMVKITPEIRAILEAMPE